MKYEKREVQVLDKDDLKNGFETDYIQGAFECAVCNMVFGAEEGSNLERHGFDVYALFCPFCDTEYEMHEEEPDITCADEMEAYNRARRQYEWGESC